MGPGAPVEGFSQRSVGLEGVESFGSSTVGVVTCVVQRFEAFRPLPVEPDPVLLEPLLLPEPLLPFDPPTP